MQFSCLYMKRLTGYGLTSKPVFLSLPHICRTLRLMVMWRCPTLRMVSCWASASRRPRRSWRTGRSFPTCWWRTALWSSTLARRQSHSSLRQRATLSSSRYLWRTGSGEPLDLHPRLSVRSVQAVRNYACVLMYLFRVFWWEGREFFSLIPEKVPL